MKQLLIAYLLGSIFGVINEIIISRGQNHCIKNPQIGCLLSLTLFNIYGWATLLITIFLQLTGKVNWIIAMSFSVLIIILIECSGGYLSLKFNHYKTWNYPHNFQPFCQGYGSFISTLYFTILMMIYVLYIYPYIHSKIPK
jgi:hypothetical protein